MAGKRSREPGELEAQVLRILRGFDGPVGARDIQALFEEPRPAYTSLLTILDRLRVKGLVAREELSPRKVRFSALQTSEEHASDAMLGVLGEVDEVIRKHEVECELWVLAREFGQRWREAQRGQGNRRGDAQAAVRAQRGAAGKGIGFLQVRQKLGTALVVSQSFVARAHAAGGAV